MRIGLCVAYWPWFSPEEQIARPPGLAMPFGDGPAIVEQLAASVPA